MSKPRQRTVHARIDSETEALLEKLALALDWSESRIIRESLKLLAACTPLGRKSRFIGVGKFSSGRKDLASNKSHLRGFGT